ncbi:hypothetical protein [Pseudoalteromonas sp. Z1A8]|uniref:hypothetical protein n=1 Tax=Pseudoalteromonas sp. Z1A8 TaxID=2686354 RepID=UPI001409667C|nr:hypothetical protein [Pseudoalteromonas sp. Z1A8]
MRIGDQSNENTHGIIGAVKIELEKGAIRVPRNHRDFYYKWTLADNKFIDVGDY